jgi:hypothetical protein
MCCPGMAPRRAQHTLWGNISSLSLLGMMGRLRMHRGCLTASHFGQVASSWSIPSMSPSSHCWAEAHIKIARMTLTIKLDGNWSSFQLANSAPPLSVTGSAIAPSARVSYMASLSHFPLTSLPPLPRSCLSAGAGCADDMSCLSPLPSGRCLAW